MLLTADLRAEEAARKKLAAEERRRKLEVEEAERDAAEMAELLASNPEVCVRWICVARSDSTVSAGSIGSCQIHTPVGIRTSCRDGHTEKKTKK